MNKIALILIAYDTTYKEVDPDRKIEFCEWILRELNMNANTSMKILFND